MMTVETTVQPSKIEGLGVFAKEFIPAGSVLWKLDRRFDVRFSRTEVEKLPDPMKRFVERYGYPHMNDPETIIVELDHGRFMNHSLTPNTNFQDADFGYALTNIHPGDELTCNYYEFDKTFNGGFGSDSHNAVSEGEKALT